MMAGKGDVTTATDEARKPAGGTGAFDGGIATKDVEPVWQTEALPGWVVHHLIPLLTAGQSWPEGSESKLWELRVEYVKLMNLLISTLDPTAATVQTLNGSLQSPAKPAIFKRLAKLYDDKAGVVAKAQESFSYAKMVDNFARETQYTKLSINVAFWIAVIAAFIALIAAGFFPLASLILRSVGTAGGTRIAMIMQRLALVASRSGAVTASGQVSKLAGAGAGSFFNKALAYELFEEISEELLIDLTTQYQQIKMGTRDSLDWKKVKAAAIGAGAGAIAGTRLGDPMSRFANDLPGISRLNRMAGDNRGVGNAFLRFPGRALNTGLNNMVASPAGSIVANYAVYDQFALPGAEGFYGGFLGGAGRTNTLSPTNLEVLHAAVTPVTSLSNVFNEAMAAQQNGSAATAGPSLGDLSSTAGPQASPSDSGATPMVPQNYGARGGRGAQTPDLAVPDAPQTLKSQPSHHTKAQQAPQAQPEPQPQPQSQPQDQDQSQAQDQRPAVQDPAPDQPSAVAQDTPATVEKTGAPDSQPTTPDPAGAPDPTGDPGAANASDSTSAPVESDATPQAPTAAAPDHTAAPQNLDLVSTPDSVNAAESSTTPETARTSETVITGMASQAAGSPMTGQQGPAPQQAAPVPVVQQAVTGERARTLVSRLIGAARLVKSSHAVVGGRPLGESFVANGRESGVPPLTVEEARAAFQAEVRASDIGENVTALRWTGPGTLVVEFSDRPDQTFVFEVGHVSRRRLGRTVAYAGNVNKGRLAPGVAPGQVARLVLHEIADTLHARAHPRQNLLRRLISRPNGRDECLAARVREEVFLTRRIGAVTGTQRDVLMAERAVVRDFLQARGMWPPSSSAQQPAPAPATPSITGLVARMNEQGRAIEYAVLDLDLALTAQIDRLLRIEADLQLQAMVTTAGRGNKLLEAVSEARAAYEDARALVHLAGSSETRITEFGTALHRARLLQQHFEAEVNTLALVPALPDAALPEEDVLRGHVRALRAAAGELTAAARRSPATAADRNAAADSALRAAESYQLLFDRMEQDRRYLLTPPPALVSQLLRLASSYEQHYRQVAVQEEAESARAARDIDALHTALRGSVAERQATVAALRSAADEAVEAAGEAVKAQRDVVRAYEQATSRAYEQAANALAGKKVEAARAWRAEAADLGALGARHERAEALAIEAREAQRELRVLLDEGNAVDHTLLSARIEAAAEALARYRAMLAELRAEAPSPASPAPPGTDGRPNTEVRRLWRHVQDRARAIEAAREHALALARRHRRAAWDAEQDARTARRNATRPDHAGARRTRVARDDGAAERRRKAEQDARSASATADFHAGVARRYKAAAEAAAHALEAVDAALTALIETSGTESPTAGRVESALADLESRWTAYEAAREATLPSPLALLGVFPAGPVAELTKLTKLVNDLLARQGVAARFTEEELERQIYQAFRAAVSPDGMILRLNAAGATVRIRLKLTDLEEVAKPLRRSSETILGRMRQGGGQSSRTDRRTSGFDFNKDLVQLLRWLRRLPAEHVRQILMYAVVRAHFGWGDAHAVSTSSQENWQGGNVEDYRGKSSQFAAKASWEVEVRTSSGPPVGDTMPAGDTKQRQSLWIPHTYLLDSPANPLQLPENERQRIPFPEHVVTAMTGLGQLADRAAEQIDGLDLSPVARQQILTTITEDLPSYLGQAVNDPSGLRRTITVDGVARAVVTVRTTVLPGALPVGGTSFEHPQEALRNASSHAGRQRSSNKHHGLGGGVGANLNPKDPDADHPIGIDEDEQFTPQIVPYFDWGQASSASAGVTTVSMRAGVHKSVGHTAGFLLGMTHTVTIQVDGHPPIRLTEGGTGLFRMAESAAYRYGLPVDPAAEVARDADGNVVLRDDPVKMNPPGREGRLPTWLGPPPDHTRGAGPALVQQVTGMNEVRAQVEEYLRGRGVLPKLVDGVPVYSRIPWVRAGQMANEQLVAEQFSAERLETGYDQAAQEGLFINLVHHRQGLAAEHYTLRITLRQDFGAVDYEGVTSAERMTNLDIGSDTHSSALTRDSSRKGGVRLGAGFQDDPGLDVGNASGSVGLGLANTSESGTSSTVNQVKLVEGNGLSAVFRVPHTIQVDRMIGPNLSQPVVKGQAGQARIVLPADLLPFARAQDGHPRPEGPRFRTGSAVLRRATVAHLDVGDVATAAANALDTSLHRDSPQFQHLAAFFNVRALISHGEVFPDVRGKPRGDKALSSGHRTGVDTRTTEGTRHEPVTLRLEPGESRFLSVTDMVVGDINLTLAAHNGVQRTSKPREVTGGLGVPLSWKVEPGSGGAAVSWGGTTTEEQKAISGPERLGIDTGKQYVFAMNVTPQLTAGARESRLHDGTVVYLLAERDALELYVSGEVRLPLHQLADAAERLMNGDLELGRRVAIPFMARYLEELEAARENHPSGVAGLTTLPGIPLTSGHSVGRALAALLELFDADRLAEFMPPGIPEERPGEPAGDTIDRMLSRPELHTQILTSLLAAAARLANGEVSAQLAPTYQHAVGMSTVKGVSLHPTGEPDTEVELLAEIMAAVEKVAPGALAEDTLLWRALTADFSGETWLGKIDDMLDPDHPGGEYTVQIDGDTEPLEIVVRAELGDDVQYRGEVFDYGQILQLYTMSEENISESSSLTGSPSSKGAAGETSLTGTTDWGRSGTGASNSQQTQLRRAASFDGARAEVRQGITLSIKVRRPSRNVRPARTRLSGTIDRLIPPGMTAGKGEVPAPVAVPDPRPLPVPVSFTPESTRADGLARAVERQLEAEHSVKLSREDSRKLARLLSGSSRNVSFPYMLAKDGHMVLKVPGLHGKEVAIHVGAVLSEPATIAAGLAGLEIGQVDRRQWTTKADASDTRLRPLSLSGSSSENDGSFISDLLSRLTMSLTDWFGVTAGVRDQSSDGSSVSGGNRDETSVFEKGESGSAVRFRVDYTVRFEVTPDSGAAPDDGGGMRRVATGEADVLVSDDVLAAIMQQAEDPPPLPAQPEPPGVPGPPRSLTAMLEGGLDARQLAAALAALPEPVVHLDADLSRPPYGQLRQAQLAARALGGELWVTVHLPDGSTLTYLATPDGRLRAQGADGGFGRRFSGIPTALVALAEQHGIDLRALHDATALDTPLAKSLRHELRRRAVLPSTAPAPGWPVKTKPDDTQDRAGDDGYTTAVPLPDSLFVADGRPEGEDDLTVDEAREAFTDLQFTDFGTDDLWLLSWRGGDTITVESDSFGTLTFEVRVKPVPDGYLGRTKADPERKGHYVMTLAPRVAKGQVARLILHEISDVLQRLAEGHGHTHTGSTEGTRDECVTARGNELRYLRRKLQEAYAAGDTDAQLELLKEITAVEDDLAARTGTRPQEGSIDGLINWGPPPSEFEAMGIVGDPLPVGDGAFQVTLTDGSSAMLLEFPSTGQRDLHLRVTELGRLLGVNLPSSSPAGDRHILVPWVEGLPPTSQGLPTTPQAVLIGYFDALLGIQNRDNRLVVAEDGSLVPLHAPFEGCEEPGDGLARLFHRDGRWRSNPLSPSDVARLGEILQSAGRRFTQPAELIVFDEVLARHEEIAANAIGTDSVLDAGPDRPLRFADLEELAWVDSGRRELVSSAPAPAEDPTRLAENVARGSVSGRPHPQGRVVTFRDGSEALRLASKHAPRAVLEALVRRALGLAGPTVHQDKNGVVHRSVGSDLLRTSAATGIRETMNAPAFSLTADLVIFNDGRWALRHVFDTAEEADEYEALLDLRHAARDAEPGYYRAGPTVVYEHRLGEPPAGEAEKGMLAARALYVLLAHGTAAEQALAVNPFLRTFLDGGSMLLSDDIDQVRSRLDGLRMEFMFADLEYELNSLLDTLDELKGVLADAPVFLPRAAGSPKAPAPVAQPAPPAPLTDDDLAGLPVRAGHVSARVPAGLIPPGTGPGSELSFGEVVEGVEDGGILGDRPYSVRLTVLASDYAAASEMSLKQNHAAFRSDARFRVLAVQTTADGEQHYFLVQSSAGPTTIPVAPPALDPAIAPLMKSVQRTAAGVRLHSEGMPLSPSTPVRPVAGAFVVEGRFSGDVALIRRDHIEPGTLAALLLAVPGLGPDDAILLAGSDLADETFPQELADATGRAVIASNGTVDLSPQGDLRAWGPGRMPGELRVFLPAG
ncbi:hypothetical protein [Nonomuraea sp. NPDC049758]|uniref:WXG100-like domain-containing protein n=1 Tax=Nonomuraea sp. NPDC049758 TaxID=3154360 RepID=UPI00343EB9AF